MKNRLMVIGKNLYLNAPFMAYIERELSHLGFLEQILKVPENSSNLVTLLQQQIMQSGHLVIVACKSAFTPVSKLLATMSEDTLILKENMLIPSKSQMYDDQSFLLQYNHTMINVVMADPGKTLPMFLIEHQQQEGTIHLFDLDHQSASALLEPLAKSHDIEIAFTPLVEGWLQVECLGRKYGRLGHFLQSVHRLLDGKVVESTHIFAYLVHRLAKANRTVTFAESCTGGLAASMLTQVSGASEVFKGSLVTYANTLKAGWLGVEKEVLQQEGAVSETCIAQMLDGARHITQADYALAISGIAGPSGGTPDKPVGTLFIGAQSAEETIIEHCFFEGDRRYIQYQSALYAYKLLFRIGRKDLF